MEPGLNHPPRVQQEEPDLPESVSFEDLEKMDESHARFLKRKKQLALPKLPKIRNAASNKGPLSQSIDPMSFRKNLNNQSQDIRDGPIKVNPQLYQSFERPVRPDMRADGASERPARKKARDAEPKPQQLEEDHITMLSS